MMWLLAVFHIVWFATTFSTKLDWCSTEITVIKSGDLIILDYDLSYDSSVRHDACLCEVCDTSVESRSEESVIFTASHLYFYQTHQYMNYTYPFGKGYIYGSWNNESSEMRFTTQYMYTAEKCTNLSLYLNYGESNVELIIDFRESRGEITVTCVAKSNYQILTTESEVVVHTIESEVDISSNKTEVDARSSRNNIGSNHSDILDTGLGIGIGVAVLVALTLIVGLIILIVVRRKSRNRNHVRFPADSFGKSHEPTVNDNNICTSSTDVSLSALQKYRAEFNEYDPVNDGYDNIIVVAENADDTISDPIYHTIEESDDQHSCSDISRLADSPVDQHTQDVDGNANHYECVQIESGERTGGRQLLNADDPDSCHPISLIPRYEHVALDYT